MSWRQPVPREQPRTTFDTIAIRCPSVWYLVILCMIVLCNLGMVHSQVYLAKTGTHNWYGNCIDNNCPDMTRPCTFDAPLYAYTVGGDTCTVVVVGGDYSESTLEIVASPGLKVNMKLGRIDHLHIKVSGNETITFQPIDVDSALVASSIQAGYYGPVLASSDVVIFNLNLEDTSIYAVDGYALEMNGVNITWSKNSLASPIRFSSSYPKPILVSSNSIISVYGAPLIDTAKLHRVGVAATTMNIDSLASLTMLSSTTVNFGQYSSVTFSSPVLLDSQMESAFDVFTISLGSNLTYSPRIDTANAGVGLVSRYPFNTVQFQSGSTITNIRIESKGIIFLENSQMINCDIPGVKGLSCSDATFTIASPNSNLHINSSEGATLNIVGLNVQVSESEAARKPFIISTNNPAMETASISTNKLWLGSNLVIQRLSVSESIECVDRTQSYPTLQAPESVASAWYFNSIAVSAVAINVSHVDRLEYSISYPSKGFIYPASGESSIPSVSLGNTPGRILLVKMSSPESVIINSGVWYPLVSNFTGEIGIEFSQDIYLDDSLYTMETRTSGRGVSSILQFRRLPIGLPPTSQNAVCPTPYPPGFECIDGLLVAIGNIDVPVIDFPPGSGVIIVFGNLSSPSPISFSDTNSFLNVSGCIDVPGIEINLEGVKDPSKAVPSEPILLASQGTQCPKSLQNIPLTVKQSDKSCKKVKANLSPQSSSSTVSVLFTLDNSDCNVKWIVLGSVLGSAFVILVILALIFTFNRKARTCIRPFSGRKPAV